MKPVKNIIRKMVRSRRGNALIMAILATMLLFIIGMAFLSTTMTERATTVSVNQDAYLDNGVRVVIDRINDVLTDDLFRYGPGMLGGNSAYDYPDNFNTWLASLEPEYNPLETITTIDGVDQTRPPHYYWRHITDLWNRFSGEVLVRTDIPYYYDPDIYDENLTEYWDQVLSTDNDVDCALYAVSEFHVPIRVVLEDEFIESPILNQLDPQPNWWNDPSKYRTDGMRADADGDGLADARWARLNRIGPEGQWLWAAVRIIDNGGMMNINTAYRNPETVATLNNPQWDGTQLTHINLAGIQSSSDPFVEFLQTARYGTVPFPNPQDYYYDIQYEEDVAIRVLNPFSDPIAFPGQVYQPFDIFDELELRNRYLMDSNVQPRCGTIWPVTFTPGPSGVGKKYPYIDDYLLSYADYIDQSNSIDQWYNKVTADISPPFIYNRRHVSTTYNFDRITRRGDGTGKKTKMLDYPGSRKVPIRLPNNGVGQYSGFVDAGDKERYIRYLACAIYRGLPKDAVVKGRFGDEYDTKEKLAWHWALNLIDAQDTSSSVDEPSFFTVSDDGKDTRYFGMESLDNLKHITVQVSKLGYVKFPPYDAADPDPDSNANYPDGGEFYAVEVFDPNSVDQTTKDLDKYELWVVKNDNELKYTLELSGSISDSNPTDYTGDTELFVFYDQDANDVIESGLIEIDEINNAFGTTYITGLFSVVTPSITKKDDLLEDNDKIYVMYELADGKYMPVDVVKIPSGLDLAGNGPDVEIRRISLPNTHFLLPTADTRTNFNPWSLAKPLTANKLGDDIDPGDTTNGLIPITDPLSTYDTEFDGFDKIQHATQSLPMRTLGEILDVPAVGFRHVAEIGSSPEKHTCTTYWQALIESAVAIKDLGGANNLDADKEVDNELGSYGKVRLDDPAFMKYVHSNNPNQRRIDANIFGLLTYFDPSNDLDINGNWVDNDGNPWTSNDPTNDDFDQDGDGQDRPIAMGGGPAEVDTDENKPQWYEQAVAGRININTAPWFVIAQLPWVNPELARAIVAYRDLTVADPAGIVDYSNGRGIEINPTEPPEIRELPGFASIYELINVTHDLDNAGPGAYDPGYDIRRYGRDTINNDDATNYNYTLGPFYDTAADDVTDDMEERDILFKRISNLVTVRSDVFTAYILVRLGRDGPQKRMIAIFDRSNVFNSGDKPKLVALHPVPDPR